jgi:hypothetical protein
LQNIVTVDGAEPSLHTQVVTLGFLLQDRLGEQANALAEAFAALCVIP